MDNVIKMEIARNGENLLFIKAFMPTWQRTNGDGKIYIKIPVFGIETYAISEDRIDKAIEEAVKCFCIAAEEVGKGLENELEAMGWSIVKDDSHLFMDMKPNNPAIDSMFNTGDQYALELEVAC